MGCLNLPIEYYIGNRSVNDTIGKRVRTGVDVNGNQTTSTTSIDRTNKTVTQTTDTPESTVNSVSVSVNGLLQSTTSGSNLTTTYAYDSLGRRAGITDPRTGQSATAYYASGAGKIGKVYTVTDAASNVTTYDYDTTTGRRVWIQNALGKKTYYAYNDHGQLLKQWGDTGYPIEKGYD
jgi:YD repeat-containing protein